MRKFNTAVSRVDSSVNSNDDSVERAFNWLHSKQLLIRTFAATFARILDVAQVWLISGHLQMTEHSIKS
jgi:hypothetical protein